MAVINVKMTRQQKDQIRHMEMGLCAICSTPRVNATFCDRHRKLFNERQRRNNHKHRARGMLIRAIMTGRMDRKPCRVCGAPAEAHHKDYSKPLLVEWLCDKHHKEEHGKRSFNRRTFKDNPKFSDAEYQREMRRKRKA